MVKLKACRTIFRAAFTLQVLFVFVEPFLKCGSTKHRPSNVFALVVDVMSVLSIFLFFFVFVRHVEMYSKNGSKFNIRIELRRVEPGVGFEPTMYDSAIQRRCIQP